MLSSFRCPACSVVLLIWLAPRGVADERVEFNRDIRPILSDKCFPCHGPDEEARQAELRLDMVGEPEGPFQVRGGTPAIKPGDLDGSAIWYRLTTTDPDEAMPPFDSHKTPLTDRQRKRIGRWILQGAEYEEFWAFVTPKPRRVPPVNSGGWSSRRIDQFVMAGLEKRNLAPRPRADRRTLARRLAFDLTGLPPTAEETRRFAGDESPHAYEELVDRLMATPRYGEHMARYWLDLVRFADTNGIHHDHYREMTPYRDWVIRSFNRNLPLDEFIQYQIAGDLYESPTLDQRIASGFNRLHLVIDKGTAIPQESFTRNVIDRVTAVGTAFLGLTVGCAVCHDHKYDPITQRDFYQLFAFFNNIDSTPETPGKAPHAPFLRVPTEEQTARLESIASGIETVKARIEKTRTDLQRRAVGARSESPAAVEATLSQSEQELRTLLDARRALEAEIPVTLVMKERSTVRPTRILIRGAYDQPGERVERDTPSFLPPMATTGSVKTRMDLARWLTDGRNPLTARVAVNRFWQQFFGVGLVRTSEDFGAQGEWPSHPALLDDLAIRFVESGWDVKALVKSIVMSETYRQSSRASPAAYRADPENRWLARGARYRLDAEMIRDQILAVSGLLNTSMYGKSVKPPQPPDLWKTVSMVSSSTYSFAPDSGEKIHRRSVYSFWKRAMPPPQMTIFDAPTRESCIARRERTNTPLQALVLMNEQQYFKAARHFARQLLEGEGSDSSRLSLAYESVTSRVPDAVELSSLRRGLEAFRAIYRSEIRQARRMTMEMETASDAQRVEVAAHAMVINALFNLDIAKTKE